MPMETPPEEDQYHGYFKAKYTIEYLEEYTQRNVFDGQSLHSRIRFASLVTSVQRHSTGWNVEIEDTGTAQKQQFTSKKLIVASGLTTTPNIPAVSGASSFGRPMIHTVDFGSASILSETSIKHITVLGGGKSAADMVYASVQAGKEVAWIVRPSGTGPGTFVPLAGGGCSMAASELSMSFKMREESCCFCIVSARLPHDIANKINSGCPSVRSLAAFPLCVEKPLAYVPPSDLAWSGTLYETMGKYSPAGSHER